MLESREEQKEVEQENSSAAMNDKYMYCLRFRQDKLFNFSKLIFFFLEEYTHGENCGQNVGKPKTSYFRAMCMLLHCIITMRDFSFETVFEM